MTCIRATGLAFAALLGALALPAAADDYSICTDETGEKQIAACTRLITARKLDRTRLRSALEHRGRAYADKDNFDRAIGDYNEAIRLDSKVASAFENRGLAYANKRDFDRAIADLTEAIRLDPKVASAYANRGWTYGQKGDYDRAIGDYNEAIRLDPKVASTFENRAWAYDKKGDFDRAITDYNEAIRLDSKAASTFVSRGVAYLTRATTTAPSRTMTRRSGSIRNARTLTTFAVSPIISRATTPEPCQT